MGEEKGEERKEGSRVEENLVGHMLLGGDLSMRLRVILHVPFLRIHHIYVMYFTSFTSCNIIL